MNSYGNRWDALIQSTVNFHNRFGIDQEPKQAFTIFREEIDEVLNSTSVENALEEIVDVVVTLIGLKISLHNCGDTEKSWRYLWLAVMDLNRVLVHFTETYDTLPKLTDINTYIDLVIEKNNAKTPETHTLDKETGKVKRNA